MISSPPLDDGMQGKWASMWFMQQAQRAVDTREVRGERLWPIHAENSQKPNVGGAQAESPSGDTEDQTGQTVPEGKRSPRGVLAVLKSRFRARAMGE